MRNAEFGMRNVSASVEPDQGAPALSRQFRIPHLTFRIGKAIGRHRLTRPGRPVRQERRGLLKPESNDWSLTMASAFPPRGHDIGHSIWVHDRAVGSIIFLPGPELQYYVDRRRQAGASRRSRHAKPGA